MGTRLLSVDDDPEILTIIDTVATSLGFEVTTVTHASLFMTTYVRIKPDVITLDIIMPDVDGIELIQWLSDVGCTAKVIIVSGSSLAYSKMAQRLGEDAGNLDITAMRKPFKLDELRSMLTGSTGHAAAV